MERVALDSLSCTLTNLGRVFSPCLHVCKFMGANRAEADLGKDDLPFRGHPLGLATEGRDADNPMSGPNWSV
eukprot:1569023-Amphidinium_carterae.1